MICLSNLSKPIAGALMVAALSFSSCDDCDKRIDKYERHLTAKEVEFSPYPENIEVKFQNASGKVYNFTSTKRIYEKRWSYSYNGLPCNLVTYYHYVLETQLSGNFKENNSEFSNINILISSTISKYQADITLFNNHGAFFSLSFTDSSGAQAYYGVLKEGTDSLYNFEYASQLSLNGANFENVNFKKMGRHTVPNAIKNNDPVLGVDSVYYNRQYGLIRFTTVDGEGFQRVI